ncbi:hypothetical protein NVP1152O_099 [Vibrio phage 1.152.O._10N.222.46.E1]|uniref:Uncharacterized protein n=5 Tax=Nahantvirus 49C7 TaxID=2846601 RepID=A0A2I7RBL0_9CAUD|nr:hypothetical protein HYP57_gp087 [Vibrio phage 1.026.O._10N.222.49.C7]AUR82581.1 hypothetical protein NVP1025O_098 [Vibrio phage 1.025.O._10N.222.46.B6]AUR90831.1 hypothetical protein NVP1150O_098 [Vibrio phage 1.150.O._10N.222.46.A6]AUR91004.1 hypothetical protein NVP1152O_099 [Vibrio phage 1.152.O._10N.222.46.E1]AUS02472.1 hypothetical protein NVP2130O_098 [Vibrio phage 2.130.O._10N.222.46.C2]AUR82689.1 hypothetical protein NVP1026O_098 [Vibrio phage 1.026.O._10N.222.49.C7]
MRLILLYDKVDWYTPWMLIEVDELDIVVRWTSWCTSIDEVSETKLHETAEEDPVLLSELMRYEVKAEAKHLDEIKLLLLLEY